MCRPGSFFVIEWDGGCWLSDWHAGLHVFFDICIYLRQPGRHGLRRYRGVLLACPFCAFIRRSLFHEFAWRRKAAWNDF